jgi:hypothetical protein
MSMLVHIALENEIGASRGAITSRKLREEFEAS